jgi:uncharacterized protein YvpB
LSNNNNEIGDYMNTNAIILFSMIGILFILFLFIKKSLSILIRRLLFSLILILIGASFFVIRDDNNTEVVLAKNLTFHAAKEFKQLIKEDELNMDLVKDSVQLDAPIINQLPELPRGCEVTSLAMLLQYAGIEVDKMTLAEEITKDTTPFERKNGSIYYGNPNDGFIGDIYSLNGPGLGVYHKPIALLAEKYLPNAILDLTGSDFEELKTHLSDSRPVWVITNSRYKKLSDDNFRTWITPSGTIKITYSEHSVLVTGYDSDYVYFNDPLTGVKNKKAPIEDFKESWVQMGKQAITYMN